MVKRFLYPLSYKGRKETHTADLEPAFKIENSLRIHELCRQPNHRE